MYINPNRNQFLFVGPRIEVADIKNANLKDVKNGTILPPRRKNDYFIPSAVRQFLYDVAGGTEEFNETHLSPNELKTLKEIVKIAQSNGRDYIDYDDYIAASPHIKELSVTVAGEVSKAGFMPQVSQLYDKLKDPTF